jgi:hypothetical protein
VCRGFQLESNWHLRGTAISLHGTVPGRLGDAVIYSPFWETVSGSAHGWHGNRALDVEIAADAARRWPLNGREHPAVAGCTDLDLDLSAATHLLHDLGEQSSPGGRGPGSASGLAGRLRHVEIDAQ